MVDFLIFLMMVFALIAAILRADFVLTLVYLLLGVLVLGRWWSQRALSKVTVVRRFNRRAFLGEIVPVRLEIKNNSLLPVVWLHLHESLPVGVAAPGLFRQVVSLSPHARVDFEYELEGRRRGYYLVGPLTLQTGDVFGLAGQQAEIGMDSLTVYPKIIPLGRAGLPSRSPLGTLRTRQPLFEDPSRSWGKREYVAGDSLRRVDWKATATTSRLQVKLFEPSIALETAIFLNLNLAEYDIRTRSTDTELAIVVAASLANWVTGQRQSVGLSTNGIDPLQNGLPPASIPVRRGRGHLMRILEVLARVQAAESEPMVRLLQREILPLAWGTTLILITPVLDEALFEGLFAARRQGLEALLVPCGPVVFLEEARRRAEYFGFPLRHVLNERDLEAWKG